MSLDSLILIAVCIANLSLGLLIFVRNTKAASAGIFFALTIVACGWLVSNYLTDNAATLQLNTIFNRIAYLLAFNSVLLIVAFTYYFPVRRHASKLTTGALCLIAPTVSLFSVTSLVAGHVTKDIDGLHFTVGPLLVFYVGVVIVMMALIMRNLLAVSKSSYGRERQQAHLILFGFMLAIIFPMVTNFIVPIFASTWSAARFAPLGTLFLVATTTYAIIRHGLFDIRLVAARAFVYVVSIGAMALTIAAAVFSLSTLLLDSKLAFVDELWLSLFSAVIALVFQPIKRFFDKLTNKYFYQDAYDPRVLFDEYNKALVSTIDLDVLLHRTSDVIIEYLKTEFCVVGVNKVGKAGYRFIGSEPRNFAPSDLALIRKYSVHIHKPVIVADDMSEEQAELQHVLRKNGISILVRLTTNSRNTHEGLGYMALGIKKSGSPYTSQDVKVIETLANELIIALQNALRFEEIERFNETLQQKVQDATHQLRESNKKLKQLNDSKDDFIGMASHQLRTPLTSVKGYISLVMDGDAGKINKNQEKLLQQAFTSSQKMVYLIADLLNVSRLKTGKFVIERTPISLDKMISEEMGQLKQEAAARGLELTYEAAKDFPILPLDETKTRQVVMNFLDNAIYYTPSGGHIHAELVNLPNSVEFRVVDDGIGVPKDERHHLFTKFYRARNAQRARPDGTGLGLYMAQKVVMAQGGAVIFNSEEGKGSTFGFTFPKDMPSGMVALPAQTHE